MKSAVTPPGVTLKDGVLIMSGDLTMVTVGEAERLVSGMDREQWGW